MARLHKGFRFKFQGLGLNAWRVGGRGREWDAGLRVQTSVFIEGLEGVAQGPKIRVQVNHV